MINCLLLIKYMSIFNTYEDITENRPIDEKFLRDNGFEEIGWGSPSVQKRDPVGSTCWQKYIEAHSDKWSILQSAILYYFPDTFTGYVSSFGFDSKNKCIGWLNYTVSNWEHQSDIKSRLDLLTAVDVIVNKLKEYD